MFSILPLIFVPGKSKTKTIGSYGAKHTMENLITEYKKGCKYPDNYFYNGEFILVMLALGYKYNTPTKGSPNMYFRGSFVKHIFNTSGIARPEFPLVIQQFVP